MTPDSTSEWQHGKPTTGPTVCFQLAPPHSYAPHSQASSLPGCWGKWSSPVHLNYIIVLAYMQLYLQFLADTNTRAVPNILFVFYSAGIVGQIVYSYSAK